MLDLDDDWWRSSNMARDIYFELRREEHSVYLLRNTFRSEMLNYRPRVVEWILRMGEARKCPRKVERLCDATLHLAVYLFDVFMDKHHLTKDELYLAAVVALVVAAKVEEKETDIPRAVHLLRLLPDDVKQAADMPAVESATFGRTGRFSLRTCRHWEACLLRLFEWRLMLPTPPHFAPYFLSMAIDACCGDASEPASPDSGVDSLPSSPQPLDSVSLAVQNNILQLLSPARLPPGANPLDFPVARTSYAYDAAVIRSPSLRRMLRQRLEEKTKRFLKLALTNAHYQRYRPSVLAAACVTLSRAHLNLSPMWTPLLQQVTGYRQKDIIECVKLVDRIVEAEKQHSLGVADMMRLPPASTHTHPVAPPPLRIEYAVVEAESTEPQRPARLAPKLYARVSSDAVRFPVYWPPAVPIPVQQEPSAPAAESAVAVPPEMRLPTPRGFTQKMATSRGGDDACRRPPDRPSLKPAVGGGRGRRVKFGDDVDGAANPNALRPQLEATCISRGVAVAPPPRRQSARLLKRSAAMNEPECVGATASAPKRLRNGRG